MLFFQEAHTVSQTLNISRRNPTTSRETGKHSQNVSTQEPKGSKTISWLSRLLQKIRTQIHRHLQSSDTPNIKGCGKVEMDPQMRKLFPDSKRIFATSTDTEVSRPPGKLHTVHRCLKIRICRHTNPTQ